MNKDEFNTLEDAREKIASLEYALNKQKKISAALMRRVENSQESQGSAFSLFQAASSLELEVRERTIELEAAMREQSSTNHRLEAALTELENSQQRLVQSEKLAALGQLIAGIAHEINTPLGVIQASIENIGQYVDEILTGGFQDLSNYAEPELACFLKIIDCARVDRQVLSSKDARRARRKMSADIEAAGLLDASDIAEQLIDVRIPEVESLLPVMGIPGFRNILSNACAFITLKLNAQHIGLSVDRASKVVFALKNFVHNDTSGERSFLDLNDDIQTVLTLYSNQIKQGVDLHTAFCELPLINCYVDELNQVWTNLIFNALQAMKNEGVLKISTFAQDDYVWVEVQDSGCGIPEEIQERVFDSFFTTKKAGEGTGLGLSIVKGIIEKHQGKIALSSQPGNTVFKVGLPVNPIVH